MALTIDLHTRGRHIKPEQERNIRRDLARLEPRLVNLPAPVMIAKLSELKVAGQYEANLRLDLGARMGELFAEHQGDPVSAMRAAVEEIARQLERRLANQRGEPAYGVPSRRLPRAPRPAAAGAHDEPRD